VLVGSTGNDVLNGDANDDFLDGNDGNDTLDYGANVDIADGGSGIDSQAGCETVVNVP
jgi:Ca2+-binding RTX toxin-like protein